MRCERVSLISDGFNYRLDNLLTKFRWRLSSFDRLSEGIILWNYLTKDLEKIFFSELIPSTAR